MDIGTLRRWIRLRVDTIEKSRVACLLQGDIHHQKGRQLEGEEAKSEWTEAERYHAAAKDIRDARYEDDVDRRVMKNSSDNSVHGNSAPTLQANPKIEVSDRISLIGFAMAIAALVTALWGIHESDFTRRHTEELRIRLEDAQAQLMAANCIKPGDALKGPLANPDRLKEK